MPVKIVDLSAIDTYINPVYRKYLSDFRRFQIFKGGAGAGKSYFVLGQRTPYNMIVNKCFNVLILRKVGKDNHSSTFAEMCKGISALSLDGLFNINHSRGAEEITCKVNSNQAIFRGLDDVLKVKSITFPTGDLICIVIEEATDITDEDLNQLNLRLRGISDIPKHMVLPFNPIDADHWLKGRFFDTRMPKEKGFVLETTYKDNEFLDDEYKEELEHYKIVDEYYYNVYVLNKWGTRSTNTVFHNLIIEDFDYEEDDLQNRRIGIDFGFNHANALESIGYRDGELYIWDERYAKRQLNASFIDSAKDIPKDYTLIADSAEPDKIQEWVNAGHKQTYGVEKQSRNAGDFLRRGINYLKSLPKIHIHATRCPNAAREFRNLKYRELKGGIVLDDIVEINDDTVAAVRYAVNDFITDAESTHVFIKGWNRN